MNVMKDLELDVQNLSSSYYELQVLWDVSFQVEKGDIVSIIGPNSAGKSTILKTIAGTLKPLKGKIFFHGEEITDQPPHLRVKKGLALVPEGRQLFPYLTVYENLESGAHLKTKSDIEETLELVYQLFPVLKARRNQLAITLSGGEQQMLAIARALMSKPRLLMLDEPSLGLAPLFVEKLYEAIEELNKGGLTVLLVEQNVYMSLSFSDKAYVVENGKIVMEGRSEELLKEKYIKKAYLGL